MPYGYANMRSVETRNASDDGEDVAIMNRLAKELRIDDLISRDISDFIPGELFFHLFDLFHGSRVSCQHGIELWMTAHVKDVEFLHACEWRIGRLQFVDNSDICMIADPFRKIMQA